MILRISKSAGIRFVCAAAVIYITTASFAAALKSTRSLPIFYDAMLAAQGFPSPLLRARIAGHETLFIVDSGASVHVLADWFAEVAAIPTSTTTGSTARGSGGKTTAARVAHRLHGRWSDGQRFDLNE